MHKESYCRGWSMHLSDHICFGMPEGDGKDEEMKYYYGSRGKIYEGDIFGHFPFSGYCDSYIYLEVE